MIDSMVARRWQRLRFLSHFSGETGKNDLCVANYFGTTVTMVANTGFHGFFATVLATRPHFRQGFAVSNRHSTRVLPS
ncbi:MAG: hypothetical protein Q8L15_19475 [Methylobacter sp.]|nr:hypothetical protein [Methylobacter sp.]